MKRVCVFCGSGVGARDEYAEAARAMAAAMKKRNIGLVYGGGHVGLMGVIADAVLAGGGEVIGVIPHGLAVREVGHQGVTELRVVHSMHERKALMADLSDGFIALPGGFGTFEEFCEIITWAQLGIHRKPCGLLNVAGYYDPLLALFDRAVADRFIRPEYRALVLEESDPDRLLDLLVNYQSPVSEKWISRGET
ncbi:MAG TPA: TIGR00730 family Rossman fold protein [Blastocatellia bacterium]|nr:TIGR00730 family Rossman fold protein [Blastocatellia bacterium]